MGFFFFFFINGIPLLANFYPIIRLNETAKYLEESILFFYYIIYMNFFFKMWIYFTKLLHIISYRLQWHMPLFENEQYNSTDFYVHV